MRVHGTLNYMFEGKILFIEGCGPWNKEALQVFSDNDELLKKKQTLDKWAVLIKVIGDPIYTPEAVQALLRYLKSEKEYGRVATAFVLTDSTSPELGEWHIKEIYKKANEECQFFKSVNDAKIWLNTQLSQ